MLKYAIILDERTGLCNVASGDNVEFYESIGMTEMDVIQSDVDGNWYTAGMVPRKTEEQILQDAKNAKIAENQQKLDTARTSHVFTVNLQEKECEFDTKDKTQSDLNSAAISASIGQPWLWTTNNCITLSLTAEDIQVVSYAYMQAVNADIQTWVKYATMIEEAQTVEEVENIEIIF